MFPEQQFSLFSKDTFSPCILLNQGEGLYSERNSRFFSFIAPIENIENLELLLSDFKKKYKDASHIVYAYRLWNDPYDLVEMKHNDREPGGTAGDSLLYVLRQENLINSAGFVARYFGGRLLGVVRLREAYRLSLKEALFQTKKRKFEKYEKKTFQISLLDYHKIIALIKQEKISILEEKWEAKVKFVLRLKKEQVEILCTKLKERGIDFCIQ